MEWLNSNREVIEMIANIAVALGIIFTAFIICLNVKALKYSRRTYQAGLFYQISEKFDAIEKEQKGVEKAGVEAIENWYERTINVLDDFCFIANRKMIPKEMADHFIPTVVDYCDDAAKYTASLKKKLADRHEDQFSEIKKIYEKNSRKNFPL